jgi:hypothetical protein
MSLADCSKCGQKECEHFGQERTTPCLSFIDNQKPADKIEPPRAWPEPPKKEDLVPTMKLRLLQSNRNEINPPVLQQWFLNRNVINPDGTAGGGHWVNVPVEVE